MATLKEIALYRSGSYDVSDGGFKSEVQGYAVWASIFDVLGIRPILGRAFLPEEKLPSQSNVVILSYDLWQTAFNRDPAIIGQAISVDGEKRTVVGIMAKSMGALGPGQILTPFVPGFFEGAAHDREFHVIAALKPGPIWPTYKQNFFCWTRSATEKTQNTFRPGKLEFHL